MKELEKVIQGKGEVSGYTFTQLKKSPYAYIYEQKWTSTGQVRAYEVFERRENTQFNCVSYPKANSFGVWAYSVKSIERAEEIFNILNESGKEKEERKNQESNKE